MGYDNPIAEIEAAEAYVPQLECMEQYGPYVYFIRHGEFIKIGSSINPEGRLNQLRRANDGTIKSGISHGEPELVGCYPGSVRDERLLHRQFAHLRVVGEWFKLTEEMGAVAADAGSRQVAVELKISGEDPASPAAYAMFLRRLGPMDRAVDVEAARIHDWGEEMDGLSAA